MSLTVGEMREILAGIPTELDDCVITDREGASLERYPIDPWKGHEKLEWSVPREDPCRKVKIYIV